MVASVGPPCFLPLPSVLHSCLVYSISLLAATACMVSIFLPVKDDIYKSKEELPMSSQLRSVLRIPDSQRVVWVNEDLTRQRNRKIEPRGIPQACSGSPFR